MKILIVGSTYPRDERDPEVPWLREKVKRLKSRGVNVKVFVPSFQGLRDHSIDGVEVKRFRYFFSKWEKLTHGGGMPAKIQKNPFYAPLILFYIFFGLISIIRLCKREKFDIIEIHWPFPHAIFGYTGAFLCGAKTILVFYAVGLLLVKRKLKFLKPIMKQIIKRANLVTTFSTYVESLIQEVHLVDVKVISYGAAVKGKKYKRIKNKTKRILFVGRHIERKGINYLIKAMPKVLKKIKAKLIIIGGGEVTEILMNISQNLKFPIYYLSLNILVLHLHLSYQ